MSVVIGLVSLVASGPVHAQAASDPLTAELCACSASLGLTLADASLERGFRLCLENAIVHHPKEMRQLMALADSRDDQGYVLGRLLGELLERNCPGSKALRDRLRMMQPVRRTGPEQS